MNRILGIITKPQLTLSKQNEKELPGKWLRDKKVLFYHVTDEVCERNAYINHCNQV